MRTREEVDFLRTRDEFIVEMLVDLDILERVVFVLDESSEEFDTNHKDVKIMRNVFDLIKNQSIDYRAKNLPGKDLSLFFSRFKLSLNFICLRRQVEIFKELAELDEECLELKYVYDILRVIQKQAIDCNDFLFEEVYGA